MAENETPRVVKLTLTDEQKQQIKQDTGHDAGAITFTVEELEARISPRALYNY
jgi:hypothetical protein